MSNTERCGGCKRSVRTTAVFGNQCCDNCLNGFKRQIVVDSIGYDNRVMQEAFIRSGESKENTAKIAEVSYSTFYRVLNGKSESMPPNTIRKVCKAIGIDISKVIY